MKSLTWMFWSWLALLFFKSFDAKMLEKKESLGDPPAVELVSEEVELPNGLEALMVLLPTIPGLLSLKKR